MGHVLWVEMGVKKVDVIDVPGRNEHPVYVCRTVDDFNDVVNWMIENEVKYLMVSTGYHGYQFQVQSHHEWFELKWM